MPRKITMADSSESLPAGAPAARAPRLCVLFPHLVLGGGETAMMALAELLAGRFELAVCALDDRPPTVEPSAREELVRRFGDVAFVKTEDELRGRLAGADALLWFGMNPLITATLTGLPARPA